MFTDSLLLGEDTKEYLHAYDEGSSTVLSTWSPVPFCDVVVCLFVMMERLCLCLAMSVMKVSFRRERELFVVMMGYLPFLKRYKIYHR
jgi:hypothetical protein